MGGGGHADGHSHDHADHGDEMELSLRPQIDIDRVVCLNEEVPNSCRGVLKVHEERMTSTPSLRSPDDDPELLLSIPFTEAVSCHSLSVMNYNHHNNNATTAAPRTLKLFCDRENIDFDMARDELEPDMTLQLASPDHEPEGGTIDYPLRPAGKFQNITLLTIFVVSNFGDESGEAGTEITYVGLKGKGSRMKRQAVECVYESRGLPKDHQVPGGDFGNHADRIS